MKRKPANPIILEPEEPEIKNVHFIGGAQEDLRAMPDKVRVDFGFQLWLLQNRTTPLNASPFEGSRANEVMKLSERHDTDTYRCLALAKAEYEQEFNSEKDSKQ